MSNATEITFVGNTCGEVELRFTPSGKAVANFSVAVTPRSFDKDTNAWVDGEAVFWRCDAWNQLAENIAESIGKGTRVIVQGRIRSESWDDKKTGEKKTGLKVTVDAIGPDLTWATAKVEKAGRSGGAAANPFGGNKAADDPWATAAAPTGGAGFDDSPPF